METAEARDEMVARVHAAFEQWPTFHAMPEVAQGELYCQVQNTVDGYIQALYVICANGIPIGRYVDQVVGTRQPLQGQEQAITSVGPNSVGMRIGTAK